MEEEVDFLNDSLETSMNDETFFVESKPFDPSIYSSLIDDDVSGSRDSILSKLNG